jgi:hypothetical protein
MRTQLGIMASGMAGSGQVTATFTQGVASGVDATSFATGTYTPTTSGLLVIIGVVHTGTATLADATSVAGASIGSVAKIVTINFAANVAKLELWKALSTGSAGAVTVTFPTSNTGAAVAMFEFANVNNGVGTAGIVQNATSTGSATTAFTLTMAAFADPKNATFVLWGLNTGSGTTPKAGWTELRDSAYTAPNAGISADFIITNDTNPTATAGASGSYAGIGVEIASS